MNKYKTLLEILKTFDIVKNVESGLNQTDWINVLDELDAGLSKREEDDFNAKSKM